MMTARDDSMTSPPEPAAPVVLLAGPGDASDIVAHYLARRFPDLVVVMEGAQSRSTLARRRAKRLGWGTVIGQVAFIVAAMPVLRRRGRQRRLAILAERGLDATPYQPVRHVTSVNAPETVALLQDLRPAVVVVNGTRIIASSVLDSLDCPIINIHTGITPQYRGVHGGYWAIAEGHPELVGTTVHLVDPGIDTGTVLARAYFQPTPEDSIATYPYLHLAAGLPELVDQVEAARTGHLSPISDGSAAGDSRLHSHPTVWSYVWRRMGRGVR
jgi:Formyl transferase